MLTHCSIWVYLNEAVNFRCHWSAFNWCIWPHYWFSINLSNERNMLSRCQIEIKDALKFKSENIRIMRNLLLLCKFSFINPFFCCFSWHRISFINNFFLIYMPNMIFQHPCNCSFRMTDVIKSSCSIDPSIICYVVWASWMLLNKFSNIIYLVFIDHPTIIFSIMLRNLISAISF